MDHEVQRGADAGVGFDALHTRNHPSLTCRDEMASQREAMASGCIPRTVTFHHRPPPPGPHVSTATIQSDDTDPSNKWQNTWPQEKPPRRGGGNSIRATLATQQAISLAKVSELQKQLAILEEKLKELHALSELDEANVINRLCSGYARESPNNNEVAEPRAASPMPSFYCISQGVNEAHAVTERHLGSHIDSAEATESGFVPMREEQVVTTDTATSSRIKRKRPGWARRVMSEPTGYENPLSETIDVLSSSSEMQEINLQLNKLFNGDQPAAGGEVNSESGNSSLYCWAPNQASTYNSSMGLEEPTCSTDATAHPIIQSQGYHSSDFHSYPVTITSTDFSHEFGEDIWEFDTCDFTSESKDTSCHSSAESLAGNRINPISESSPHPQVNGTTKRVIMGHGDLVEVKVDSHNTLSVENWSMDANSDGRGESSLLSSSSGLSGDYSMKTSQCNSQGSGSNDDRPGTSCTHAPPLRRNTGSSGSMNRARSVTPLLKRRKQSAMNITLSSSQDDSGSDVDEAALPLSSPRSEESKSPHQILKSAIKTTTAKTAKLKSPKKGKEYYPLVICIPSTYLTKSFITNVFKWKGGHVFVQMLSLIYMFYIIIFCALVL